MMGTQLVEQKLDDALDACFTSISKAINEGDATPEQALDVMREWGVEEHWLEFIGA